MEKYSFCEFHFAGPLSPWHIRKLSDKGPKYGGGIDTPSLCERSDLGWDIKANITLAGLADYTCKRCAEVYNSKVKC